jgi:RNA polymerase sigma-B factor
VDRDTAERLRTRLRHAIGTAGVTSVSVDLAGVPLVDAAGVTVLLDAVQRATTTGMDVCVTGSQPYVARILAVSGLAGVLRRC